MAENILLRMLTAWLLLGNMGHSHVTNSHPQQSMMLSCKKKPFLSVSVSTPARDSISDVQIMLADPRSQEQGVNVNGRRIPRSHYKFVVEIPTLPDRSRVHAIEICGAEEGQYALTVYEHGDELYRVDVRAGDTESMTAYLHSSEGRIRRYKFLFKIKDDRLYLTWLDNNGQPQLNIGNNDW